MSDRRAQAQRYAQAIMQAMVERWQDTLGQAGALMNEGDTATLLKDDSADVATKLDALKKALPQDAPAEAINLLGMLIQADDMSLLPEVSAALAELATGQRAPLKADITSAVELSDQDKESLRQKLMKDYGEGLLFNFHVDQSLMGGLRVRVGDRLIDTSISSRLAALRDSLASVVR